MSGTTTAKRPHLSETSTTNEDEDAPSPEPSGAFIVRRGNVFKRKGEPPKNEAGKYVCKVDDRCRAQTFNRKCEWGKHMDKHERPYRCDRPECSKLNGFTYAGGLLRHEREVHKMHGSATDLFCPDVDCKRAKGNGFTRKDNLREHLRRAHKQTPEDADGDKSDVPGSDNEGRSLREQTSLKDKTILDQKAYILRLEKRLEELEDSSGG